MNSSHRRVRQLDKNESRRILVLFPKMHQLKQSTKKSTKNLIQFDQKKTIKREKKRETDLQILYRFIYNFIRFSILSSFQSRKFKT